MKLVKLFILCINQKKSLKQYTITSLSRYNEIEFNYKNGYTIFMNSENRKTSETQVKKVNH